MIRVKPLIFIAEIKKGHKVELADLLEFIHNDLLNNEIIPFDSILSIHFARIFILDEVIKKGKEIYPASLVISTNFDGSLENHLEELISNTNLASLLEHCKGFPMLDPSPKSQVEFIKDHINYRSYFYAGTWGRSVARILKEDDNRHRIEKILDDVHQTNMDALSIKAHVIKDFTDQNISLGGFPKMQFPLPWKHMLIIIACILLPIMANIIGGPFDSLINSIYLIFGIVLILFAAFYVIRLRQLERKDEELQDTFSPVDHVDQVSSNEDQIVQNQFTHVVELRQGWLRKLTLKTVLYIVGFAGDYIFHKGKLGTIPTIHFARWVFIDKGKRLLFLSNYDGSWENYLGDFVDKASFGLTAIWSNTKDFPRSKFLIGEGAKDEQRFKAVARSNQVYTPVWYSAYPHLTVTNITQNKELQYGLTHNVSEKVFSNTLANL